MYERLKTFGILFDQIRSFVQILIWTSFRLIEILLHLLRWPFQEMATYLVIPSKSIAVECPSPNSFQMISLEDIKGSFSNFDQSFCIINTDQDRISDCLDKSCDYFYSLIFFLKNCSYLWMLRFVKVSSVWNLDKV